MKAPGQARPDWQITAAIAARFDEKIGIDREPGYWQFESTSGIFDEMVRATPIYAGMRHDRLEGSGLQWPCPTPEHPGTAILHSQAFSRGLGKFTAIEANDPAEMPDEAYPLVLTTGRVLYHYHTGTMTRRSAPLDWREPGGFVELNAVDAAAAHLGDGEMAVIRSRRGKVAACVRISEAVPPGMIFLAFHWRESPANMLTQDFKLDPVAKIPEYKVCAVRLEKAAGM